MEDFGGFSDSTFPTTNAIFNTGGTFNIGEYSDPNADKLINASVFGSTRIAVKTEAPTSPRTCRALFQPNAEHVWAWKTNLSGPPSSSRSSPSLQLNPEHWYFTSK